MSPLTLNLIIFLSIVIITFLVGYILNKALNQLIKNSTTIISNDPTNYKFLKHLILAIVYLVGFSIAIYAMPNFRALAGSLLAGAGIFAVAVGFASQHALSNVVSGMFIVIFKPFRINDRLSVQMHQGVVEDITLRHTVIRNFENRRIIIPNSIISNEIIVNADFEEEAICKWIDIGISYNSDIDKAKKIIEKDILDHPLHVDNRTPEAIAEGVPEVIIRVVSLMDSSVNLRAWAWAKDAPDAFELGCDIFESVKKKFDLDPDVEIPYPHRTIYMGHQQNMDQSGESK